MPDEFYAKFGVNMTPVKRVLFAHFIRHRLNARVENIRKGEATFDLGTACAGKSANIQ